MSAIIDFLKSVAGVCQTNLLPSDLWDVKGDTVSLRVDDVPEFREPGGAVYVVGKGLAQPVFILRDPDGTHYRAFSNKCTHMGRKLDFDPDSGKLRCCSVSHSAFDLNGKKVGGPAKGPLSVYPAEVVDGVLKVKI